MLSRKITKVSVVATQIALEDQKIMADGFNLRCKKHKIKQKHSTVKANPFRKVKTFPLANYSHGTLVSTLVIGGKMWK